MEKDNRVPISPDVEKEIKKLKLKMTLWNGVVREYTKNLHFRKGHPNYFILSIRFNEWRDVQGGMCNLKIGNNYTNLPHIKTIEDIKNLIKVLEIKSLNN